MTDKLFINKYQPLYFNDYNINVLLKDYTQIYEYFIVNCN